MQKVLFDGASETGGKKPKRFRPYQNPKRKKTEYSQRTKRRKNQGLCVRCGASTVDGKIRCRACAETHNKHSRSINAKRKEVGGDSYQRWLEKCADQCKKNRFKVFEITHDDYVRMLAEQGNCCAICGSTDPRRKRRSRFDIDHDHQAEQQDCMIVIRGLLCSVCNRALGLFLDDPSILRKAADYLEQTPRLCRPKQSRQQLSSKDEANGNANSPQRQTPKH
jgi:hypothetical protein